MRRVPEFDALRALAVLGVMLFHLSPQSGWTVFGMTGVHLFFVLSGYLITDIAIDHAGRPHFLRSFYARRALRIWPAYYLTLAFLVVVQHHLPIPSPSYQGLPYYVTFTQYTWNWPFINRWVGVPAPTVYVFEHSWTLAVEQQFYLLWPLAIVLAGTKRVGPMALGVVGFGLWFKTLGYDTWILFNSCGAFALGALIAAILNDRPRVDRNRFALSWFFLAAGASGLAYLYWYFTVPPLNWSPGRLAWRDSFYNFAYYSVHFGIVGYVSTNAGAWFLAPLRMRELTYLGEVSYGMYLYHLPVYWVIGGYWVQIGEPWTMWVTKIALTFLVATVSYRYFERPILSLKEWFPYGPGHDAGATPARAIRQPRMIHARSSSAPR